MKFEEIYETYFKDVYLYIRRLSGNDHVAEEITSETFFKALQSINKFRGECEIRVWLCQIAKNCYYTYLEKNKKYISLDNDVLSNVPDNEISTLEKIVIKDDSEIIRKLLHTIPEPYKEVFMWRVFADLSFKQIGQLFNKSDNWACVTYHRARLMIRERMEDSYE